MCNVTREQENAAKITMTYYLIQVRLTGKKSKANKCWEDWNNSSAYRLTVGGNVNQYNHCGISTEGPHKTDTRTTM